MSINQLNYILQNNQGNTLTQELIHGILNSVQQATLSPINIEDIPLEEYAGCTFQVERLQSIVNEIHPIHQEHWLETEGYRHGVEFNMNYDYPITVEQQGKFIQFTVRKDGKLIGNCGMYLSKSNHTQQWMAIEDTIFILSEYRKGRLGIRFIKYVEDILRNMGISELQVTVKTVNKVNELLQALGYKQTAFQLNKVLQETTHNV